MVFARNFLCREGDGFQKIFLGGLSSSVFFRCEEVGDAAGVVCPEVVGVQSEGKGCVFDHVRGYGCGVHAPVLYRHSLHEAEQCVVIGGLGAYAFKEADTVRDGFCRLPVVACLHVQDCEPVVGVGGPVEDEVVRSVSVDVLKSGADTGQGAGITGDNTCGEGVVDAVLD